MEIRRYTATHSTGYKKDYYKLVHMYKYRWMGGRVLKRPKITNFQYRKIGYEEVIFDTLKEAYEMSQNITKGHEMKYSRTFSLDFVESIPLESILFTHSCHLI